jgi:hypothetical protein
MPFYYWRDDKRRRLVVSLIGRFAVADVYAIVDRRHAEDAWGYNLLCDLTQVVDQPTPEELQRVADYVQRRAGRRPRGRVAVVAASPNVLEMARLYATVNEEAVRVAVFPSLGEAERWLDELPES